MTLPAGCAGIDCVMGSQTGYTVMAEHYGQMSEGIKAYEMGTNSVDKMLAQPNQSLEAGTKFGMMYWWTLALDLNRPEPLRVALEKLRLTWSNAGETLDTMAETMVFPLRRRGDTTPGLVSVEYVEWMFKMIYVLLSGPELDAEETLAAMPSWEEHVELANCGYAWPSFLGSHKSSSITLPRPHDIACTVWVMVLCQPAVLMDVQLWWRFKLSCYRGCDGVREVRSNR
jgi:hypothetical protein